MENSESLHIVMVPWLAISHLNPMFELSKVVTQLGHHVYLATTKPKIQILEAQATPSQFLHFVPLMEEDISHTESWQEPLARFLQGASPKVDWVLYDTIPYWVPTIAAQFGIRTANVCLVSATANSFMWPVLQDNARPKVDQLISKHSWAPVGSNMAFHAHEALDAIGQFFDADESGISLADRIRSSIGKADVVAVRSSNELEGEWLQSLSNLCCKLVFPLGHLPPNTPPQPRSDISTWLESQTLGSVLYVACGSYLSFTSTQIEELAHGIEMSGVPFMWALRCPDGLPAGLIEGFEERTNGRGLMCKGWVPQVDILAHHAVGGFLSHCGWNSMLEAIQYGVPIMALPLYGDQYLNARFVAYKGFGVEVLRKEGDGRASRDEIAKVVREVMLGTEGSKVRAKAKDMKDIFGNREFHERYVNKFMGHLLEHKVVKE